MNMAKNQKKGPYKTKDQYHSVKFEWQKYVLVFEWGVILNLN